MIIRDETAADIDAISEVTVDAFQHLAVSNHTELLVGDPGYYQRFGFRNYPELIYEGIPQQFFVVLPFGDRVVHGSVQFHEAFMATK